MTEPELVCLFWTTSGVYPGDGEISPHDLGARVEAAARAGFRGIGIWHTDLEHILVRRSLKEVRSLLEDNGMRHLELEFLTDWFVQGPRRVVSDVRRKRLLEASAALGAKHVKVGDFDNTPCPLPRLAEEFAALCREAEAYGATIGYELMKSTRIDSLEEGLAMVRASGARNGGLILDIVHVVNLGIRYEVIERMPPGHLVSVELNDGTYPGSPRADPARARRFCGEGEYDIRGFIAAVRRAGYEGPWAVEVFSPELAGLPLRDLTERAYRTTREMFDPASCRSPYRPE